MTIEIPDITAAYVQEYREVEAELQICAADRNRYDITTSGTDATISVHIYST